MSRCNILFVSAEQTDSCGHICLIHMQYPWSCKSDRDTVIFCESPVAASPRYTEVNWNLAQTNAGAEYIFYSNQKYSEPLWKMFLRGFSTTFASV